VCPNFDSREPLHDALPFVSVVLPVRNEGRHIDTCIERLLEQDYPLDRMEIVVVDGDSNDDTRERLAALQARHPDARLRVLENPDRIVPHALNIAIRAAAGEVIVRMDGHSVPDRDYVRLCVRALAETGAANVGGVVEPVGTTPFGRAVALATQHRLGVGDAKYRTGGAPGFVDTVQFGAFRRDVFDKVGLFDESMVRNQDYELNVRIRNTGERIYLDPAIRFTYTPRGTPKALWRQYFQYGWWRVETVRRHPRSIRLRQLVPPAFVSLLLTLGLIAPWSAVAAVAFAALALTYGVTIAWVAIRMARKHHSAPPSTVALAFVILHFSWSTGFLMNLLTGGRIPYRALPPRVPALGDDPPAPFGSGE